MVQVIRKSGHIFLIGPGLLSASHCQAVVVLKCRRCQAARPQKCQAAKVIKVTKKNQTCHYYTIDAQPLVTREKKE
jgi:hypothetical protein